MPNQNRKFKKSKFTKLNISATIWAGISSVLPETPSIFYTACNVLNQIPTQIIQTSKDIINITSRGKNAVLDTTSSVMTFSSKISYNLASGILNVGCELSPIIWGAAGGVVLGYVGYAGLNIYSNYYCSNVARPFYSEPTSEEWKALGCHLESTVGEIRRTFWACKSHVFASVNANYSAHKDLCYKTLSDAYFLSPFGIGAALGSIYGLIKHKEAPSPSTMMEGALVGAFIVGGPFALCCYAITSESLIRELEDFVINNGCTISKRSFEARCRGPVSFDTNMRHLYDERMSEQTLWTIYVPLMVGIALSVFNSKIITKELDERPRNEEKVSNVPQTLFSKPAKVLKYYEAQNENIPASEMRRNPDLLAADYTIYKRNYY